MNPRFEIEFKFRPKDFVTVKVFGLKFEARIQRCINDGGGNMYDVEYAHNGELRRREFHEDELSAAAA